MSTILISLAANTAQFIKGLSEASNHSKRTTKAIEQNTHKAANAIHKDFERIEKQTHKLSDSFDGLKKAGLAFGAVTAAISAGGLFGQIVDVRREFEVLGASLETATGSAESAMVAMNQLRDFAKKTPYDLSQTVEGFVKLKNLGLTPTTDALNSFGNTAAAMGKDLSQMIEAVADATTFEFERLKEFGIKAKQEKDKVAFTFQGVTTEVAKNATAIEQYLTKIGDVNFAGAMSKRMATIDGAIANLKQSYNDLLIAISEFKIGDTTLAQAFTNAVNKASYALGFLADNLHLVAGLGVALITPMVAKYVAGFASMTASNIAHATSSARLGVVLLDLVQGHTPLQIATARYIAATKAATVQALGFTQAMLRKSLSLRTATVSMVGKTRATFTLANAQRLATTTALTMGRGVMGIGTAFASLGRIILAHPIMIIGGVIAAIIVRTMGLQKAMESLSDAVQIVGLMLGDLLDVGIDAFKGLLAWADKFLDGFLGKSNKTTSKVSGYFGELFKGTKGGFVGVLQAAASMFDKMSGFAVGFVRFALAKFNQFKTQTMNLFRSIGNAITEHFEGKINGVIDTFNAVNKALGGDSDYIARVEFGRLQLKDVPDAVFSTDGGTNLRSIVDGYAHSIEQSKKSTQQMANSASATAQALNAAADSAKGKGKANKNAKDTTDKLTEAQKQLAKAFLDYSENLEKTKFQLLNPRNLEIEKLKFESQFGSLQGIDKDKYDALHKQAFDVDVMRLQQESAKIFAGEVGKSGQDSFFARAIESVFNPFESLSLLKDTDLFQEKQGVQYGQLNQDSAYFKILQDYASVDVDRVFQEQSKIQEQLEYQLKLLSTKSDLQKQHLENEQEYQSLLSNYEFMQRMGLQEEYKQIQAQALASKQLKDELVVRQDYQRIVESLTGEQQKQLQTVKEQFAVIAQMASFQDVTDTANATLNSMLGFESQQSQFDVLNNEHNQKLAIVNAFQEQMQLVYQDHEDKLTEITAQAEEARTRLKQEHTNAQIALTLSSGAEILDGMAGHAKAAFGENSKAYRAMFAMQKGFAIAQSMMNLYQSVSEASKQPFPANIGLMAKAMTEGLKIVGMIRSIRSPVVGQAHDGIMSVPKSGTWNLEKGERVLPKHTAKALDKKLDSMGGGTQKVIINNYTSEKAEVQKNENGDIMVMIGKAIDAKIEQRFMNARRQGGELYGR